MSWPFATATLGIGMLAVLGCAEVEELESGPFDGNWALGCTVAGGGGAYDASLGVGAGRFVATNTSYQDAGCVTKLVTYEQTETFAVGSSSSSVSGGINVDSVMVKRTATPHTLAMKNSLQTSCGTTFNAVNTPTEITGRCSTPAVGVTTYTVVMEDSAASPKTLQLGDKDAVSGQDGTTEAKRHGGVQSDRLVKQ